MRAQAAQPGSELRARLTEPGHADRPPAARRPGSWRRRPSAASTPSSALVLGRFDEELAALVSGTIARWDAVETSRRLELLLGPDLQYIRINGTIVGAIAGLALHAISVGLS